MNKKMLDELVDRLRANDELVLANLVAIIRYKATMWDKYNEEGRIREPFESEVYFLKDANRLANANRAQLAAESGGGGEGEEISIEELWEWCTNYDPEAKREEDA